MQSKAAKRYKRRLLASMTDQQTPEAVRSRVMELEKLSTPEIAALPRPALSDQVEVMAQAQVMMGRLHTLRQLPGGDEVLAEAWEKVGNELRGKGAPLAARMAFGLAGKFFTGAR